MGSKGTLRTLYLPEPLQGVGLNGQKVTVGGWVKTGREQGKGTFAFLELNDGSCFQSLQVVVQSETYDIAQVWTWGA